MVGVSSSSSGFDVKDQWTGELDSTYFFTRNFAVASPDSGFTPTSVTPSMPRTARSVRNV
jgi:outer membrane protein W